METLRRTALVTGANKGLGFETARQLAEQGFTVWLGARDEERGRAAARDLAHVGDVRFVNLDVENERSVEAAAEWIGRESGSLDVLVNNAGIAVAHAEGLPSAVGFDTIQRTFEVNFYGALRVTQAFLPLVRKADAGRIVNVSSSLGSLTLLASPDNPLGHVGAFAYPASKTLLNALTAALAAELRDTTIKVTSVCPGSNVTGMNSQGAQHPSEGAKVIVRAANLGPDSASGTFMDLNGAVSW